MQPILQSHVFLSAMARALVQARGRVLHEPIVLLAGVTIGNFAFWQVLLGIQAGLHLPI